MSKYLLSALAIVLASSSALMASSPASSTRSLSSSGSKSSLGDSDDSAAGDLKGSLEKKGSTSKAGRFSTATEEGRANIKKAFDEAYKEYLLSQIELENVMSGRQRSNVKKQAAAKKRLEQAENGLIQAQNRVNKMKEKESYRAASTGDFLRLSGRSPSFSHLQDEKENIVKEIKEKGRELREINRLLLDAEEKESRSVMPKYMAPKRVFSPPSTPSPVARKKVMTRKPLTPLPNVPSLTK